MDDRILRHAVDVGLGPWLYKLVQGRAAHSWKQKLRAQSLAAQIESASRLDALEEILDASQSRLDGPVALLKGMSLALRLYPEPHLRLMGDLDLLVDASQQHVLETVLRELGYADHPGQDADFYAAHHHGTPLMNPRTGIVVEVHRGLFRPGAPISNARLFQRSEYGHRLVNTEFRGHQIRHLDPVTDLAYLATHWINERRFYGSAVVPILDLALVLRGLPGDFDWQRMLEGISGTQAAVYVRVALTYLHSRGFAVLPSTVLERLGPVSGLPGSAADSVLHRLIDRHALDGKAFGVLWSRNQLTVLWEALLEPRPTWINLLTIPWRLIFPPRRTQRYGVGVHWRRLQSVTKRLAHSKKLSG